MPAGLQVWDASGNVVIDLSTRLSRVIDVINPNYADGSKSYPGLQNNLVGIVSDYYISNPASWGTGALPHTWSSGTTVYWQWQQAQAFRMDCRILVFGY